MANKNELLKISDEELIVKIKEDVYYLGVIQKKYKSSSLKLLSRYSKKLKHITTEDIFSESCYELYKNIVQKDKGLTNNSSLQTYLNKICLNQLLKELNGDLGNRASKSLNKKFSINEEIDSDYELIELEDRLKIINSSNKTINPEWLPDDTSNNEEPSNDSKLSDMKTALDKIKDAGGHCYELLKLFFWEKSSMKELMEIYGYKNERTTIQQKAKCQKRLKIIMQKEV